MPERQWKLPRLRNPRAVRSIDINIKARSINITSAIVPIGTEILIVWLLEELSRRRKRIYRMVGRLIFKFCTPKPVLYVQAQTIGFLTVELAFHLFPHMIWNENIEIIVWFAHSEICIKSKFFVLFFALDRQCPLQKSLRSMLERFGPFDSSLQLEEKRTLKSKLKFSDIIES